MSGALTLLALQDYHVLHGRMLHNKTYWYIIRQDKDRLSLSLFLFFLSHRVRLLKRRNNTWPYRYICFWEDDGLSNDKQTDICIPSYFPTHLPASVNTWRRSADKNVKFIFHASLLTMPVDFSITCLAFLSPSNNVRVTKRGNYGAQTRNLQRCHQCVALSKHTTSCEFYSNVCRQLLIQYTLIKETGITQKSHCCCLSKITTIKYTNETELNLGNDFFVWEICCFQVNCHKVQI